MTALKVYTFAGSIIGDEDQHVAVLHEPLYDLATFFTGYAAMDYIDSFRLAEAGPYLVDEIMQRVLRFGEDDQLAPVAIGIDHQVIVEDAVELGPLGVLA